MVGISHFAVGGYPQNGSLLVGELPEQTPWFNDFKQEFMRMLMFSDLDTLDQPVACTPPPPLHTGPLFHYF